MDQVLFACYAPDVRDYRHWAELVGCGLELHMYAEPDLLTHRLSSTLGQQKRQLAGFKGVLGMHGAFYDMICASRDPAIVDLTRRRFQQSLTIASELGVQYVVFHLNYMGGLKLTDYRPEWERRQIDFWGEFIHETAGLGITILLENMWADDPTIVSNILTAVDHAQLQACLDIAHAALFSPRPVADWIDNLAPHLYCCHLNNHDGQLDLHWPLTRGIIDYQPILAQLRSRPQPPLLTLELPDKASIEASLPFLNLPVPA